MMNPWLSTYFLVCCEFQVGAVLSESPVPLATARLTKVIFFIMTTDFLLLFLHKYYLS